MRYQRAELKGPWDGVVTLSPGSRLRFGRHSWNDVVIDAPRVSSFHLELVWEEGQDRPQVRDLATRAGTRLDGVSLPIAFQPVRDGALLELGAAELCVRLVEADPEPPRPAGRGGSRRGRLVRATGAGRVVQGSQGGSKLMGGGEGWSPLLGGEGHVLTGGEGSRLVGGEGQSRLRLVAGEGRSPLRAGEGLRVGGEGLRLLAGGEGARERANEPGIQRLAA